jgi:outer membrane lipopolysaccharide assembly protein LptE/RlpB
MKKNISKKTGLCLVAFVLLTLSACGYQLIGGKGIYGGEISSIYISIFNNSTFESSIAQPVTDSFSKELLMTGLFTINREVSDAYLKGDIRNLTTTPNTLSTDGAVIEKVVTVELMISLYQGNGKLVKQFNLSDSEYYKILGTAEEYNRREAIRRMSARMARRFSAQLLLEY